MLEGPTMDDARVLDNVCEALRAHGTPVAAREIVADLARRGIFIDKQSLNQILWNRNDRPALRVDEHFRWSLVEEAETHTLGGAVQERGESVSPEVAAFWDRLDFVFRGVRRKRGGPLFFFLGEQGTYYRLVGPNGNVLSEPASAYGEPDEFEPDQFTKGQLSRAAEEAIKDAERALAERNRAIITQVRDTELYLNDVYIGPLVAKITDSIPASAIIMVAILDKLQPHRIELGWGAILQPLYLVVNTLGFGLEDDMRYGVFKLCVYDLIKQRFAVEDEGNLVLTLQYRAGKVFIIGERGTAPLD
jgi:hypothetical protein